MRIAYDGHRASDGERRWLPPGTAINLGQKSGELSVLEGHGWLTRSDDARDYFLLPGQHVLLTRAHGAVIESATKGQGIA